MNDNFMNNFEIDGGDELEFPEEIIERLDAETVEDVSSLRRFPLGMLWGDFQQQTFTDIEAILCGIRRGQVGMLNAVTNVGKTVWALNQCLILAAGGTNPPFVNEAKEMRVMFIDFESSRNQLQEMINRMTRDWSELEKDKVRQNLWLICDEDLGDELLTLSNPKHLRIVEDTAREFKPDLIVVDTLSAAFELKNENDNAEIAKVVMKPLKALAAKTNAGVLLIHHIGKMSEDSKTPHSAYAGRGGSSLACNARAVMNLIQDKHDKSRVVFTMPKVKGRAVNDTVLRFNPDSLWFSVTDEVAPAYDSSYTKVVNLVTRKMETAEIIELAERRYDLKRRRIEEILKEAVQRGDLKKSGRGTYEPKVSASSAFCIDGAESAESRTISSIDEFPEYIETE